ncbi:60S ribosomal protein L19-3-like [Cucumis melo var. makuwa]|uniref:Ribosomal protein L19 n=1 Tax=Cucumis melo var. makuwa TaxID=1194695 RepID=A0A5D3DZ34_CUCMM|nr:60S ribosomal protein L19-3-like [Cucumis melo var. makuwa]
MVSLTLQKRLAASSLDCGKRRVWLDPNETTTISLANSTFVTIRNEHQKAHKRWPNHQKIDNNPLKISISTTPSSKIKRTSLREWKTKRNKGSKVTYKAAMDEKNESPPKITAEVQRL